MVLDQWIMQSGIANGHIFVLDMEGTTLSHFARTDLTAMIKFMYYLQVRIQTTVFLPRHPFTSIWLQEALPLRLRGMHFINTVSLVDKILAMKRPFLREALKDKLYVHTTMDNGKPKTGRDLFGFDGNFKQLAIDWFHNCTMYTLSFMMMEIVPLEYWKFNGIL